MSASHPPANFTLPDSTTLLLKRYLYPHQGKVVLLFACLVAVTGCALLAPLIVRSFIDAVSAGVMPSGFALLAAGFIAAALFGQAARVLMVYVGEEVGWAATNALRRDLTHHCLHLDASFHNEHSPGELTERLDGDVTVLAGFFSQFTIQIVGGCLMLAGILVLLVLIDYRVGAVMAVFAVTAFVILRATRQFSVSSVMLERESRAGLAGFLEERVGGLDDIRANGAGAHVLAQHADISGVLTERGVRAALAGRTIWVLTAAIAVGGSLVALGMGVYLFKSGEISLGTVLLFVQCGQMINAPLNQIGSQLQEVQRALASLTRIRQLLAVPSKIRDGTAFVSWGAGAPGITFDNVGFSYPDGTPALANVSFALNPGEVLGLLGTTGSGKSTIARLIARIYDPTSGEVTIDGVSPRDVTLAQLHRRLGMVTQDVQVFSASVRENVRVFDPTVADADIMTAIAAVGLESWFRNLPDGLDTRLHPAESLSAGQAQLLAFTRVFLQDPGLIVMDEPSSRLDPVTEAQIEFAVDQLLKPAHRGVGRTAVIIAHKLKTLERADRVLVLEHGRIVESGPRQTLATTPDSRLARLIRTAREGVLDE